MFVAGALGMLALVAPLLVAVPAHSQREADAQKRALSQFPTNLPLATQIVRSSVGALEGLKAPKIQQICRSPSDTPPEQ